MSKKILAVASAGGHFTQLLKITKETVDCEYLTTDSSVVLDGVSFHYVNDANADKKILSIILMLRVLIIIIKVRPSIVISTGAAPGFFAIFFGKLLGAKTIWIDSIANAEQISKAGRMAAPYVDYFCTQWKHLATDKVLYKGAVL